MRNSFSLCIVVVLVSSFNLVGQPPNKAAEELYKKGLITYLKNEDYNSAISHFTKAIELDTKYGIAYYARGLAYEGLQKHSEAVVDYSKAIELDPNNADAYSNRGIAYEALGKTKESTADYTKAIELNPNDFKVYWCRGKAYVDLRRNPEVIADCTKAIELNPKFALPYNARGKAYADLRRYAEAIADYTKAIELDPADAGAYYNRGQAYRSYAQRVFIDPELAPRDSDAFYSRGNMYYKQKMYPEAIADYTKAIELDPTDPIAYYNRGFAYASLGKTQEANADRSKAITLDPYRDNDDKYRNCSVNEKYYKKGFSDNSRAIELGTKETDAYFSRAWTYKSIGRNEEAIADYTKAIELKPSDPRGYEDRGKIYIELRNRSQGRADLKRAGEISKNNYDVAEKKGKEELLKWEEELLKKLKGLEEDVVDLKPLYIHYKGDDLTFRHYGNNRFLRLDMVLIPAGNFMMGSNKILVDPSLKVKIKQPDIIEMPQHEVTLTKPFYMGKYEVTEHEWNLVMGQGDKGSNLAKTSVSWNDCQEFIKRLNQVTKGGYRLPTEAEWEYACRAGTTTPYSFGNNFTKNESNKPNAFGLCNMHGGVSEWCQDWYLAYPGEAVKDPKGSAVGINRVFRGGASNLDDWFCRSSSRTKEMPHIRQKYYGFRLARTADIINLNPAIKGLLVAPFTETKAKDTQKEVAKSFQKEVEKITDVNKEIKLKMVFIPAGKFVMGSPVMLGIWRRSISDNERQHEVTLTKPFYMGKYEVTQEQWEAVMGKNPSDTKAATLPVTGVSWFDCQEFVKNLNAKTNGGYRLPTEAEWEYACRAGTIAEHSYGEGITHKDANYDDSEFGIPKLVRKLVAVGSYKPNAFGLYDMHGNVLEWCEDWLGDYPVESVTDPKGSANGEYRILRGGSFYDYASTTRSAFRSSSSPSTRYSSYGFRLAKTP